MAWLTLAFLREHAADYAGDALPVFGFDGEALEAAFGDGVEAGFAVVFRSAPFGFDPVLVLETQERGVDGSFVEGKDVFTQLLDAAGDAEAMLGTEGVEGLEDHEIEGALQNFGFIRFFGAHGYSFGHCKEGSIGSFGMSTEENFPIVVGGQFQEIHPSGAKTAFLGACCGTD